MNKLFFETIFTNWVDYSLLGMVLLGIAMVFYKLPSIRKEVDANGLNVWSSFFFLLFATFFFLEYVNFSVNIIVLTALAYGVLFTLRSLLQMHGLKYASTDALFPVTSTGGLLVVIVAGLIFFGDKLTSMQWLGVVASIVVFFFFGFKGGKLIFSSVTATKIWLGIVVLSAAGNLLNKVGAILGDVHTFQFFVYIFIFISGLGMLFIQKKGEVKKVLYSKGTVLGGLGIGIFGFFGAWALILALRDGPVSVAQTINSSYVIVTSILASLFFGEIMTKKKITLIICGVLALAIIYIGS